MVLLKEGVTKLVPVAIAVPPEEAVYQLTVPPEEAVAPSVKVPAPHLVAGVVPVIVGVGVTVAKTAVRATELQPADEVACA